MPNLMRNVGSIQVKRFDGHSEWAWYAVDDRVGPPFRVYCANTREDAEKLAAEMLRSLPAATHAVAGEADGVYERAGVAKRVYDKNGYAVR